MLRPGGYAQWTGPAGEELERDTFSCNHCGVVVFVKPRGASISAATIPTVEGLIPSLGVAGPGAPIAPEQEGDLGGHCMVCDKDICGPCVDRGHCMPVEKQLELIERGEEAVKAAMKAGMPSLAPTFVDPSYFRRP